MNGPWVTPAALPSYSETPVKINPSTTISTMDISGNTPGEEVSKYATAVNSAEAPPTQTDADEAKIKFFEDSTPGWVTDETDETRTKWANSAMYPSYIEQEAVHEMQILGRHSPAETSATTEHTTSSSSVQPHYLLDLGRGR